ncbi:hypothetical protein HN51_014413 [Arachis hypogaea]|uniref:Putative permease/transmembrane protein n=1 Tax=Arachis duranensis TaxID=130453 RepID=N1NKB0_ARADU|nr:putative permease/transmembrane protein [Arachis duranensis]
MGSNEGEENGEKRRIRRAYLVVSLLCLVISVAGGFVLGWWLYKYHPKNKQLWMVPFGFVLFLTPIICCLCLILPDFCTAKTDPVDATSSFHHPVPKRLA